MFCSNHSSKINRFELWACDGRTDGLTAASLYASTFVAGGGVNYYSPCSMCPCLKAEIIGCLIILGRLLRVDLIKWVLNVRPPIRTFDCPQKVSSILMKFGM